MEAVKKLNASRLRIGICHANVAAADAICNDMLGMYHYLENLEFKPTIVAQHIDQHIQENYSCHIIKKTSEAGYYDILIYHHSVFWELGKNILDSFYGKIIFKFHNITPSIFFEFYSNAHVNVCKYGLLMTKYLVQKFKNHLWLADSEYNKKELCYFGLEEQNARVVPPFNKIEEIIKSKPDKKNDIKKIIFVGRFVPNKGHMHLIKILKQYLQHFSNMIELHMIGSIDFQLQGYFQKLIKYIYLNDLENHIKIFTDVPLSVLQHIYQQGDLFLCLSEHEGFCVPIIEAQAFGIPVVAGNKTAIAETMGPQQLVCDFPTEIDDYFFYAQLISQVLDSQVFYDTLVNHGLHNVRHRFTNSIIGQTFLNLIRPTLERVICE